MNYTNEELNKLVKDLHSRDAGLLGAPIVGTLIKLIEDVQESERMRWQAEEVADQWRCAYYRAKRWAKAWKAAAHKFRESRTGWHSVAVEYTEKYLAAVTEQRSSWADAWKAAAHKYREGYRQAEHILEELDWRPDA